MSVIVRDSRGHVTLYCKGADTLVYERLSPNQDYIKRKTSEHMEVNIMKMKVYLNLKSYKSYDHMVVNIMEMEVSLTSNLINLMIIW